MKLSADMVQVEGSLCMVPVIDVVLCKDACPRELQGDVNSFRLFTRALHASFIKLEGSVGVPYCLDWYIWWQGCALGCCCTCCTRENEARLSAHGRAGSTALPVTGTHRPGVVVVARDADDAVQAPCRLRRKRTSNKSVSVSSTALGFSKLISKALVPGNCSSSSDVDFNVQLRSAEKTGHNCETICAALSHNARPDLRASERISFTCAGYVASLERVAYG